MRGLQDYRVLRLLGAGGEGSTFLALDLRLMRRVVIKVRRQEDSRALRHRFLAEARRVAQLEGARVVQVLDAVASGADAALILRYVPGCNLEELLQRRRSLEPAQVLSLLTDLAEGLAAARQQLLVHGDLKAANVLLGRDGRAAITDFGVAVARGRAQRGASVAALTPEHLRGEVLTQQSDFFALGILAYRMLTGRHPFQVAGRLASQAILDGNPAPWTPPADLGREAGRRLAELLDWLLQPRAGDRPPGTMQLRNALREVRAVLPPARGLARLVQALGREEEADATAPPLPRRLRRPPWIERWWSAARGTWHRATPGARLTCCASALALLGVGILYLQRPGLCVLVLPPRLDVTPSLAAQLPTADSLQLRLRDNLKAWREPPLVLGDFAGSDSRPLLRPQGLRDVCTPERQLRLSLRCAGPGCELAIASAAPGLRRRGEVLLSGRLDLQRLQQEIDQLLAPQLEPLLTR